MTPILAGKIAFLLMVFLFSPPMIFGALRGVGFSAGNAFLTAVGAVGFITLQWLL
jgi:hypothetical protein